MLDLNFSELELVSGGCDVYIGGGGNFTAEEIAEIQAEANANCTHTSDFDPAAGAGGTVGNRDNGSRLDDRENP